MALKAKKPAMIESRLKALFYGNAGVGKTMAAIQFPKPYIIDTEGSTNKPQYVKAIDKVDGAVLMTVDFDEMVNEVRELLTTKHEYKTLVIDSLTLLYNDLLEKAERKVGTDFGRHYGEANKRMKQLLNLLFRLDMNVIITSHSKNEYGQNLAILGQTFDCYKKLDYLFDLVFEIQKRGVHRVGLVKKSRIESFPDGESFPFSYEEIAKLYGRHILEREAVAQELATVEQVKEITRLIDLLKVPEETFQKWLDKATSESWQDMQKDSIQKCIDHLTSKIKGE
ncbi:MAG TPA: AAA family ATPase [Candidatus Brocadiaceae bacterium]